MKTIWKSQFEIKDEFELLIPKGAKILAAQIQRGVPCIWFELDTDSETVTRLLRVHGTGHPIDHEGIYVGTFQTFDMFVFHLYDLGERTKKNWPLIKDFK